MILNADALEALNSRTFDKLLSIAGVLVEHTIEAIKLVEVEAKAAEKLAKFSIATAMVQIGSIMHRKIGSERADVREIVDEAWEDAEGDPEKPTLRLVPELSPSIKKPW